MRVRMWIEVELSNEALLKQFGERLPMITASHELEAGLVRALEVVAKQLPGVEKAKGVFVPELL